MAQFFPARLFADSGCRVMAGRTVGISVTARRMPRGIWLHPVQVVAGDAFLSAFNRMRYGRGVEFEYQEENNAPDENDEKTLLFHVDDSPCVNVTCRDISGGRLRFSALRLYPRYGEVRQIY